jgi:starvation-inducible DNA-binding protein
MVATTETRTLTSLKHSQANAIQFYLNSKRYHWYAYGPLFRDLHLFFDELAADALAEIDPLGERIRMLGGEPLSTPQEIQAWVTIAIADGKQKPHDMLREALANEERTIDDMRAAVKIAEDEGDPGTSDIFATLVQTHEKHRWFASEFLRHGDGLVSAS